MKHRFKLINKMCDNVHYLVVEDGKCSLTANGWSHHLSSITSRVDEFTFAIEDAKTYQQIVKAITDYCNYVKSFNRI